MTPVKEDYLKIIFELGGTRKKVSNKQIAMSLNVAAGSVTEMVNKLVKEGLVDHTPYAGISLSPKGRAVAEDLVRRHRLWETFLVGKLNYKLADVHEDAEVLEHVASPRLLDHLAEFMGNPTHCPHGGVIPAVGGNYAEDSHTVLAEVPEGKIVTIQRVIDNHDLLTYLDGLELKIGEQVKILAHAPFEGSITFEYVDTKQTAEIGFKAAHYVFVNDDEK